MARGVHEVDDGFAFLDAFRAPHLDVRGISVVFGNAPLRDTDPIARRLAQEFADSSISVYRGAGSARDRGETDASRALESALRRERLTILAIGPVTNLASVLALHPELAKRIDRVIAVAGRRRNQHFSTAPDVTPFRDFNFEMDPVAFQIVLDSKVPLVLAPWELSSHVWLREADLNRIRRANPAAGWLLDAASDWLGMWKRDLHVDGFNPFDTLAVGYAEEPDLFGCEILPITIEIAPDDVSDQKTEKPYLIVDKDLPPAHTATYCSRAPSDFAKRLVDRLCLKGHL